MQLDTFSSHGSVGDLRWNLINLHLSSPILFFLPTLFDPVTRELVIHLGTERIEIPVFISRLRRVNSPPVILFFLFFFSGKKFILLLLFFHVDWCPLDCSIEWADNRIHVRIYRYVYIDIFFGISKNCFFFSFHVGELARTVRFFQIFSARSEIARFIYRQSKWKSLYKFLIKILINILELKIFQKISKG